MGTNTITYQKTSDTPDVAFYSVPAANSGNSGGGEVIVGSTHYNWDSASGGFTGTGWWGANEDIGPAHHGGFATDQEVTDYLSEDPTHNLNAAFDAWQRYINSQPDYQEAIIVGEFNQALLDHQGAGCMTGV